MQTEIKKSNGITFFVFEGRDFEVVNVVCDYEICGSREIANAAKQGGTWLLKSIHLSENWTCKKPTELVTKLDSLCREVVAEMVIQ